MHHLIIVDKERTMHMLQSSLRASNGARVFNVPHTTILRLRYRLQGIVATSDHPRSGWPPRTTPARDWHIRLKHLRHQWRPPTRTAVETPGCHNVRISTETIRYCLRRFTLRRPCRSPILNRQQCAARLNWVMDCCSWCARNDGPGCDIAEASVMPMPPW